MRTTKRKPLSVPHEVSDKVRTIRGTGVIKHVFIAGPYGKPAYAVLFENKRIAEIFREDEVTLIEKRHGGGVFSL